MEWSIRIRDKVQQLKQTGTKTRADKTDVISSTNAQQTAQRRSHIWKDFAHPTARRNK